MKKSLLVIITIITILSLTLTACKPSLINDGHKHSYSSEWSYDADEHYHKCSGCDEVTDKAAHTYKDGKCTVCGYEKGGSISPGNDKPSGHKHSYSGWTYNVNEHYHKCTDCDEVTDKAAHTYKDEICTVCGFERKPSEGLDYELNEDQKSYSVRRGSCRDKDIIIPNTYLNYPVTSIGRTAFYNCDHLQSVAIGSSVISIGYEAFRGCTGLQSIGIPDSVTSIGEGAFRECSSLRSIEIPDSVTSIGVYAFGSCTDLRSIEIPDSVTSIGNRAFSDCSSLRSIEIPDSITSIGDYTFSGCGLQSIEIPDSITSIGGLAFAGCYKLIEICNNSSLDLEIGSNENGLIAFYARNIYSDKEGSSKLKNYQGCSFYIDDSKNERYLLSYNGNETNITLPDSYNGEDYEIYESAFRYCNSLQSIVIGHGVTSIGMSAFSFCDKLRRVYYHGTAKEWKQIEIDNDSNYNIKLARKYYYSASDPKKSDDYNPELNYWHYNASGEAVIWEK